MKLLVAGGGAAGAAAAHAAVDAGLECTWVLGTCGATSASSGALDWTWNGGGTRELEPAEAAFAASYGFRLPGARVTVATCDGVARAANGVDASLLDLEAVSGARVAVIDLARPGWDAPALCRSLAQQEWSQRTNTRFVALKPTRDAGLGRAFIATATDAEFAHALAEVLPSLAECISGHLGEADRPQAVLFGPWLCADGQTRQRMERALGLVVGETTSAAFGLAGSRFEAARTRWLERVQIPHYEDRVERLVLSHGGVAAAFGGRQETFDRVVLAVGGFAGGGVRFDEANRLGCSVELEPPAQVVHRAQVLLPSASPWGVEYQAFAPGDFEAIGLRAHPAIASRVSFAGDAEPDRPRTMLQALRSGIAAVRQLRG